MLHLMSRPEKDDSSVPKQKRRGSQIGLKKQKFRDPVGKERTKMGESCLFALSVCSPLPLLWFLYTQTASYDISLLRSFLEAILEKLTLNYIFLESLSRAKRYNSTSGLRT